MNIHQQSLVALLQCHAHHHHHHLQMCATLLTILLAWQHLTDTMTAVAVLPLVSATSDSVVTYHR